MASHFLHHVVACGYSMVMCRNKFNFQNENVKCPKFLLDDIILVCQIRFSRSVLYS